MAAWREEVLRVSKSQSVENEVVGDAADDGGLVLVVVANLGAK